MTAGSESGSFGVPVLSVYVTVAILVTDVGAFVSTVALKVTSLEAPGAIVQRFHANVLFALV